MVTDTLRCKYRPFISYTSFYVECEGTNSFFSFAYSFFIRLIIFSILLAYFFLPFLFFLVVIVNAGDVRWEQIGCELHPPKGAT